jgi:hypothetical protein
MYRLFKTSCRTVALWFYISAFDHAIQIFFNYQAAATITGGFDLYLSLHVFITESYFSCHTCCDTGPLYIFGLYGLPPPYGIRTHYVKLIRSMGCILRRCDSTARLIKEAVYSVICIITVADPEISKRGTRSGMRGGGIPPKKQKISRLLGLKSCVL